MEQARLVRWALSMAIDREGIVEVLQAGLGTPIYLELMGPKFPGWRPERTVTQSMINSPTRSTVATSSATAPTGPSTMSQPRNPTTNGPGKFPPTTLKQSAYSTWLASPGSPMAHALKSASTSTAARPVTSALSRPDAVAAGWEDIGVSTALLTEEYGGSRRSSHARPHAALARS